MRTNILILIAVLAILGALNCSSLDPIQPSAVGTGSLNFARYHAVGNSLTAGTQNNGLVEAFQKVSYPALINQAVRGPSFSMPTISEAGIPPLLYVSNFSPLMIDTLPSGGMPTNTTFPGIYNNMGIPGAELNELLNRGPTPPTPADPNPFWQIILRDAGTFGPNAIAQVVAAAPTVATAWVGANDIFGSASVGTDLLLTPVASFEADYIAMMDLLVGGAGAVIAGNIVDIPAIPFFSTFPPVLFDPTKGEPVLDPGGNLIPLIGEFADASFGPMPLTSLVTLAAAPLLAIGTGIPVPAGGTGVPMPSYAWLEPGELTNIRDRLDAFNTIIDTVCTARGVPVVDFFGAFNRIASSGFLFRGEIWTSDYLTGGIFSMDGFHPSSIGQFIVALEFIRVMNASFGAAIPAPLFPKGPHRPINPADITPPAMTAAYSMSTGHFRGLWLSLGVDAAEVSRILNE